MSGKRARPKVPPAVVASTTTATTTEAPNPYDLQTRPPAGARIPQPERPRTQEEINEMLENHFLVPPEMWNKIPLNARIRLFKVAEHKFLMGGFVIMNTDSLIKVKTRAKPTDVGYAEFSWPLEEIAEIWKRYDYSSQIELQLLINSVKQLGDKCKELQTAVDELQDDVDELRRAGSGNGKRR